MENYIIITDMDGTLLDASTYSFSAAETALELIRERGVPLVLCSSKTRAEIEFYRKSLGNTDPFISENGGGVFVPKEYFPFETGGRADDGYEVITLGTPYDKLREAFFDIQKKTGITARGFGDMDARDVAVLAGLSTEEAELAKLREFDEPFVIEPGASERVFIKGVEEAGLRWTKGGRFYHLMGDNDKGKAVDVLLGFYGRARRYVRTVGLGDSPNDIPLLEAVDIPVLVQKEDGRYASGVNIDGLVRADGVGPVGWNKFIKKLLRGDERKAR